jgi:RecA/RadA recombinase
MSTIRKKRRSQTGRAFEIANAINSMIGKPVLRLGSDEDFIPIKIPTGSLVVDRITGGGLTLGRHVELYGDESACKSYVMLRAMALSQERGNLCALIAPDGFHISVESPTSYFYFSRKRSGRLRMLSA